MTGKAGPVGGAAPEDDTLVARLRAGDEQTFAALVDGWSGWMLRLAGRYVPSPSVAEEVVQEAWLAVLQGLEKFRGESSLRTWVHQIVLNQGSFPDCDGNYPSTQPYPVGNSTSAPPAPNLYTGTQDSVNTFYVQLEQRTGLCKPYRLARSMGVELTDPDHERVPSFTLGVPSVSPLEMAGAYATFANRGVHCDTKPVTEILNSEGKLFKKYEPACKRVMSKYTADTVNDILRGVMEGGFGSALQIGKPSAGKTGTIQDNKAVWFNAFTPEIAGTAMIAVENNNKYNNNST